MYQFVQFAIYILCAFRVCHSCVHVFQSSAVTRTHVPAQHTLYTTLATRENLIILSYSICFSHSVPRRMAVLHGSLGSFDKNNEQWPMYCERVDLYLAANNINNGDQRRTILLSVCDPATYQLIRSLVTPEKPTRPSTSLFSYVF